MTFYSIEKKSAPELTYSFHDEEASYRVLHRLVPIAPKELTRGFPKTMLE